MNTIRDYVESMFLSVPRTEETEQLKADILANMEDKYEELRAGGASDNEAIGAVITEFGNIDEVLEEMDIKKEVDPDDLEDVMIVEEDAAHEYIEAKRRLGIGIGLGVLSILVGLSGFLMILGFGNLSNGAAALGLVFFAICTALGVGLFILHGMRISEYSEYGESYYVLVPQARKSVEEMQQSYKRSHAFSIILGVAICVLSIVPVFLGVFLGESDSMMTITAGIMMFFIGVGVFFFIFTGNVWGAYETILSHGQTFEDVKAAREEARKKTQVSRLLDEVYWPIVVIIYLAWSFLFNTWAYSWLIFMVAGVVYSGILMFFGIDE